MGSARAEVSDIGENRRGGGGGLWVEVMENCTMRSIYSIFFLLCG